jgi:hypothetical protein
MSLFRSKPSILEFGLEAAGGQEDRVQIPAARPKEKCRSEGSPENPHTSLVANAGGAIRDCVLGLPCVATLSFGLGSFRIAGTEPQRACNGGRVDPICTPHSRDPVFPHSPPPPRRRGRVASMRRAYESSSVRAAAGCQLALSGSAGWPQSFPSASAIH